MVTKYEALQQIFEIEKIAEKLEEYKGGTAIPRVSSILDIISLHEYSLNKEIKDVSSSTITKIVQYLWPDKVGNTKLCSFLLHKYEMRYCLNCREVKFFEDFSKNASKLSGLNTHCKPCYTDTTREYQRYYQATRDSNKTQRTPSWANLDKIREIYRKCPAGYHVDHIVPLMGKIVSGLHVENNLQYLTAEDNLKKHNSFN